MKLCGSSKNNLWTNCPEVKRAKRWNVYNGIYFVACVLSFHNSSYGIYGNNDKVIDIKYKMQYDRKTGGGKNEENR